MSRFPSEGTLVAEEERAERALPFREYGEDSEKLSKSIKTLEQDYQKREQIIASILEYGTGHESEEALRMYSIPVLERWESSIEKYRAKQLAQAAQQPELKREVAELRADIAELRSQQAEARATDKAKLQVKIDQLHGRLNLKLAEAEGKLQERSTQARQQVAERVSKSGQ